MLTFAKHPRNTCNSVQLTSCVHVTCPPAGRSVDLLHQGQPWGVFFLSQFPMASTFATFLQGLEATLRATPPPTIPELLAIVGFAKQQEMLALPPPVYQDTTEPPVYQYRDLEVLAQSLLRHWQHRSVTRQDLPTTLANKATGFYYSALGTHGQAPPSVG